MWGHIIVLGVAMGDVYLEVVNIANALRVVIVALSSCHVTTKGLVLPLEGANV